MTSMLDQEEIVKYYDECETDYRLFWDLDRSLALHAGYWDSTTRTLHEALARENEVLAQKAKIQSGEKVLDAGCGVGGSSIYLADKYMCRVTGISLSEQQVSNANKNSEKRQLEVKPEFFVMDYTKTTFADEAFDVVWGLESICHAEHKEAFIKEAYRILKPKGRLIVADGFATKSGSVSQNWLEGWGVNHLESITQFDQYLESAGFQNITFSNITENVLPSSRRLFWISIPAWIYSKVGELFGFRSKLQTENIKSAFHQYRAIKKGHWQYGIFYAEKK